MEWKKNNPELGRILAEAIQGLDCQKKIMFGAPVYVVNGNMFAGVHGDNIFLRLGETHQEEIARIHKGVAPFEPLPGRTMKEYVVIPQEIYGDPKVSQKWLKRGHDYALSLPPKAPKGHPHKTG